MRRRTVRKNRNMFICLTQKTNDFVVANLLSATSPQLSFKKWSFPDQNQVFDFGPAGNEFLLCLFE